MGGFCGVISKDDCTSDLFFGTDYPMWKPSEEVQRFLSLGVEESRLPGIFHENFENFLKECSG